MAKKLSKSELMLLDYITEHQTPRGFTLGKGPKNDERTVLKLIEKREIVGHPWEDDKPVLNRYYTVMLPEDDNGFRFGRPEHYVQQCYHHRRLVKIADWDAIPDSEAKSDASQNGLDTAMEQGYADHPYFDWISLAFAISTYELLTDY